MKTTTHVCRNAEAGTDSPLQSACSPCRGPTTRVVTPSLFPTLRKSQFRTSFLKSRPASEPLCSDHSTHLGKQLRHLRIAAGISAGQLSMYAAVSRSMLPRIENGLVSPSVDAPLFDATPLHGTEALVKRPASHLSVVFTQPG